MADYSRPAGGFSFKFAGQNTKTPADKMAEQKYALAQNIRAYDDESIRSRPGLAQIATSATGRPVSAMRAYSAISTDNLPRYLFKSDTSPTASSVFLDNGTSVDTGYSAGLGASFIPYRPNQSPQSFMYIGDKNQYRKLSAPSPTNTVTAENVGIAEPQFPIDAGLSDQKFSYIGAPVSATYTPTGSAGAVTTGNRISDTVQGVYPDPTGCGITTLQVSQNTNILPPAIYKIGAVTAYFWHAATNGVFQPQYPLDPSTAVATATGNSLNFNAPGFSDPTFMPMQWANITGGAITSSFVPWTDATKDYIMTVLADLYVPAAGNYVMNIVHDDGMFFAIPGAHFVSGPNSDGASPVHTKTAVAGYSFEGGGIAGNNHEGAFTDIYVINFPTAGVYPIEIDYSQRTVFQTLNVYSNGSLIIDSGGSPGYQRYMSIAVGSAPAIYTVQDVFPPLPNQLAIDSIYYYSGTTGRCVITPSALSPVPGNDGQSLYEANILSGLRRGSLVQIGSEVCLVLNVTTGPTGNVCFETSTSVHHTNAENLFGVPAISILGTAVLGDAISSGDIIFPVGTGIGAVSSPIAINPFITNNFSFQLEDYIHLSLNIDKLENLSEMKILFDVSDSSFTRNFYFYAIRPNDIVQGISNKLTQLGVAQLVAQRAVIDQEKAAESGNQGFTTSSSQSTTGDAQWSEILFPISSLTRVGNDQSKSLQNVVAMQILFNCTASINVQFNSLSVIGGYAPDVGDIGAPYQYIVRARSSITGAKSNPCPTMRYGVTTRRGKVTVYVPISYTDSQADTWDIFRMGGALTAYTYVGSVPIGSTNQFLDTYSDSAVVSNQRIEYDNFEPWPTIDLPLNVGSTQHSGTTAVVQVVGTGGVSTSALQAKVLRYLPGNLVQLGQQVYTLWTRPTLISDSDFLFQFVENTGSGAASQVSIYEPALANQILPYLWGPTEQGGNIFAVGDSLRPGFVSYCKNFQPDSAPDSYNLEICPPSEPLLGGEILNGISYVASTDRWWQLQQSFGRQNQYTPQEAPVGRGLAAPFGHCTDGSRIYFVAKDGIYVTTGGLGKSLTDDDLYNLFPHDGVPGINVTYNGVTTYAPDYGRAETFRLAYCNSYLYFDYQDSTGVPRTLVFDMRHQGWSTDVYLGGTGASVHYGIEQQEGSLEGGDLTYGLLVVGGANGSLYREVDNAIDGSIPIRCYLATREMTAGDERAQKLFGDVFLDFINPTAASATGLQATSMSLGAPFSTTSLAQATVRQQKPIDLSGGTYAFALGLFLTWTVPAPMSPVTLYTWQPSYISKPESTAARAGDWDNAGYEGAKWMQGFILEANSSGVTKQIGVRNADNQALQQVFPVNHPIQKEVAYSFTQPFVTHMLRLEPQDGVPWNFFNVKWIYEPTPETVTTWWTQGTALGWEGFGHVYNINAAYASQAPVTFTMFFDGNSQSYTLPSTGGQYRKYNFNLRPNKGKIYSFRFQSTASFADLQLWLEDFVMLVGGWDRTTSYDNYHMVGGVRGDKAKI